MAGRELMPTNDLVSIVTAVRNGEKYLEKTILSVLGQTHKNTELIVIDGGSTDGTLDIIKKYQDKIVYWISEPDRGMYDAINKGLKRAGGNYIAYLNSDDLYFPDTVGRAVAFFAEDKNTYMVYGDCDFIDADGNLLYKYRYPDFHWEKFVALDWMSIPQPTVFWRREVHDIIGFLDPTYKMAGDFEFFSRIGRRLRVSHLRKPLAQFRIHGDSLSAKGMETNRQEVKRMRDELGLGNVVKRNLNKYSREIQIKAMNFPLMAKKILGMIG